MSREHPLATSPSRNGQGDWHQRCSLFHLLSLSRPNQTLQHYRSRYGGACLKEIKTIMISNWRLKGCYRVYSVLILTVVSWEEVVETGHVIPATHIWSPYRDTFSKWLPFNFFVWLVALCIMRCSWNINIQHSQVSMWKANPIRGIPRKCVNYRLFGRFSCTTAW